MPEPLYLRHGSSLGHDTGQHPERAARITAVEQELERVAWKGYAVRESPPASLEALTRVHAEAHVEAVRRMSERGGWFDPDTTAGPGSWEAALHAAGGACALVEALLSGDAPTGFSAHRPPGHHAEPATAMGFCLFNNIAVAARHAIAALGARRVLIFDWDVHHGNGTNDIFRRSSDVLFASIHQSPFYPGTGPLEDVGSGEGAGYSINLPVPAGSGDDVWLSLVEHIVVPAAERFDPDLILVSAGYDAHRDDLIGGCDLDEASFAEMARATRALGERTGAPVGAVLEGGYTLDALARSVAATMDALAADTEPRPVPLHPIAARAAAHVGHHWNLER